VVDDGVNETKDLNMGPGLSLPSAMFGEWRNRDKKRQEETRRDKKRQEETRRVFIYTTLRSRD